MPWRQVLTAHRLDRLALCILVCVGFGLSLQLLDRFSLREDEAIYSFWALHFWRHDPFFLTVWPDKPPLFLWLLAVAFDWWGASAATGRLLNIMLTLLTALVIGATARRLWGTLSGFIASLLYLLNPFVLSFAPTVYTDPMVVLAGQLALWSAISGRGFGAGFWLAVAIMTKQQGLLYAPLIGLALWHGHPMRNDELADRPAGNPLSGTMTRWVWFVLGLLLVIVPILYWDSLRWSVAPSPWDLGIRNYGALQLLAPTAWLARSRAWATIAWYFTASWLVWMLLTGVVSYALFDRLRLSRLGSSRHFVSSYSLLRWMVLWGLGFGALHVVTSLQVWDRYLLPLIPIVCLVMAWASGHLYQRFLHSWPRQWQVAGALVGLFCLLAPARLAAQGGIPIGADHGAYRGLPAAINWLQAQPPNHAILYDQQLGWQFQFYLYDQLASGTYERRWFPTAAYLADNAAKVPNRVRLLVQPDWAPQPDLALHLAVRQLQLIPQARFDGITIYAVQNKAQSTCTWCLCQPPMPWPTVASHESPLERAAP